MTVLWHMYICGIAYKYFDQPSQQKGCLIRYKYTLPRERLVYLSRNSYLCSIMSVGMLYVYTLAISPVFC